MSTRVTSMGRQQSIPGPDLAYQALNSTFDDYIEEDMAGVELHGEEVTVDKLQGLGGLGSLGELFNEESVRRVLFLAIRGLGAYVAYGQGKKLHHGDTAAAAAWGVGGFFYPVFANLAALGFRAIRGDRLGPEAKLSDLPHELMRNYAKGSAFELTRSGLLYGLDALDALPRPVARRRLKELEQELLRRERADAGGYDRDVWRRIASLTNEQLR